MCRIEVVGSQPLSSHIASHCMDSSLPWHSLGLSDYPGEKDFWIFKARRSDLSDQQVWSHSTFSMWPLAFEDPSRGGRASHLGFRGDGLTVFTDGMH